MKNVPRVVQDPSPMEYYKPEEKAPGSGFLSESDNPAGDALANALQARRQALASRKIGLQTDPNDKGEQ